MKNVHNLAADLAHQLASINGILLATPSTQFADYTSFYLKYTHKVMGDFYARTYGFGLSLQPPELDLYNHLLDALPNMTFKGYTPQTRSNGRIHQIFVPDMRGDKNFQPLINKYMKRPSIDHNKWANEVGIRLYDDFIRQMLPIIQAFAKSEGRI